jgi:hypothetical protein
MNGPNQSRPKRTARASAKRSKANQCKRKPQDVAAFERFEQWHKDTYGREFRPQQVRNWPATYPPSLTQNEIAQLQWTIDEAEQTLKQAAAAIPQFPSDIVSHDQHLWLLLFDFGSVIYLSFRDQAEAALRRGTWTLQEYSVYAGSFLRDIGEGLSRKIQELASSPENRDEWNIRVLAQSEFIFAIVNSIRVRQKAGELVAAAKKHVFENPEKLVDKIRDDTLRAATRKGDSSLLAIAETVNFVIAEAYLGITPRQRLNLVRAGILASRGGGRNRQITVESLKKCPPPQKTGSNAK